MKRPSTPIASIALLTACVACADAAAGVVGYSDYADFTAAIAGLTWHTEDFEGAAPGTLIADGGSMGGIRYDYDFAGTSLMVSDLYDTTSPSRFLGTDDGAELLYNEEIRFSLGFDPAHAVGMFFISVDFLADGDIALWSGNAVANLAAGSPTGTLPDGSGYYFLGFVDDLAPSLSAVDIVTSGVGVFAYTIDDIILARSVSAPESLALIAPGLVLLVARRRKRPGGPRLDC